MRHERSKTERGTVRGSLYKQNVCLYMIINTIDNHKSKVKQFTNYPISWYTNRKVMRYLETLTLESQIRERELNMCEKCAQSFTTNFQDMTVEEAHVRNTLEKW